MTDIAMAPVRSEGFFAALSGKREDIPKVLAEHADKIHRAATGN